MLDERPVTVHRFEQLWREDDRAAFAIECSAGTYVRVLVADLGDAYCEQLRRTAVGPFELADADPGHLLPLGDVLEQILPSVRLEGDDARRAAHGVAVGADAPAGAEDVLLLDDDGPDRDRPAARRRAQARRRLPRVKTTGLSDLQPVRPRARRVAVGTFDGVTSATARSSAAPTRC